MIGAVRPSAAATARPLSRVSRPTSSLLRAALLPQKARPCPCWSQIRSLSNRSRAQAQYKRFGQTGRASGFGGLPGPPQGNGPRSGPSGTSIAGVLSRLGGGKGGGGGGRHVHVRPIMLLVFVAGGIYFVIHLERVPQTGRLRFMDVSVEQEEEMGMEAYKETLRQYRGRILPPSHPQSQMVRRVSERIVRAIESTGMAAGSNVTGADGVRMGTSHQNDAFLKSSGRGIPDALLKGSGRGSAGGSHLDTGGQTDWEVFVIKKDDEPNAFVTPGGKIFVFTGILPICKDEDGLAVVLGHEIAHQLARHSAEKMAGTKLILVAAVTLDMLGLDIGLSRAALQLLLQLPNSRKTETEADLIGLRLMAQACFDPHAAQQVWQRMQAAEGGGAGGGIGDSIKGLLTTHPVNSTRIENMKKWLPEALEIRENSGCPAPGTLGAFSLASGGASRRVSRSRRPEEMPQPAPEEDPYGLAVLRSGR